jgi:hypothetical protein
MGTLVLMKKGMHLPSHNNLKTPLTMILTKLLSMVKMNLMKDLC